MTRQSSKTNEMQELKQQVDSFDKQVKEMTIDNMNKNPRQDYEPPHVSQKEIENSDIYIKPSRWIADGQKFNSEFQKDWEFQKEYVHCIPVHNECRGDMIEFWTHPFGGKGAEFWQVLSDKPCWIPRYAAEQLTRCKYNRLKMDQKVTTTSDHSGSYFGQMILNTVVQRIDAVPVHNKKSIFMGKVI